MTFLTELTALLGDNHVLTGTEMDGYIHDWTGKYHAEPLAVLRPADTAQVAECVKIAARHGVSVVPASGRTGLVGGLMTKGGVILSIERLNRIREVRADSRMAIVDAGVILSKLHDAAEEQGLYFPLWFGARGSAMIGGVLSTNAGGSNVLRYGSTRSLCLGLEVVLADGRILNLMSELHKDNSGYDLKQMFIGSEGTLGIITAAIVKLVPKPKAYATATLAVSSLKDSLAILNRLQAETGGLVEGFEFMPRSYMERLAKVRPDVRQPFSPMHDVNILVELAATAPRDCNVSEDGSVPLTSLLEEVLAGLMEEGIVLDAEIAYTQAQRAYMWERRELAGEVVFSGGPVIDTDISVPLDKVEEFIERVLAGMQVLDPGSFWVGVSHLGDGNVHFNGIPTREDAELHDAVVSLVEDVVQDLHGSFSAEHGVGLSKKRSMARRKDPVAMDVMRQLKAALDPQSLLNPGKVIPESY